MKKPMSKRRAREFRDARLKRLYGDRKKRAERWAMISRFSDHPEVIADRIRRGLPWVGAAAGRSATVSDGATS